MDAKRYSFIMGFIFLMFVTSSCVNQEIYRPTPVSLSEIETYWKNPLSLPRFIREVTRTIGQRGSPQTLCAFVVPSQIGHPDQSEMDVHSTIRSTTEILVDNQYPQRLHFYTLAVQGADVAVCFDVDDGSEGLHLATIIVRSASDQVYTHSWAFMKEAP